MTVIVPKDAAAQGKGTATYAGVSGDVLRGLQNASAKTGVDFGYLLAQASIESGLNPTAKASTSSARGLFQFIESTWLKQFKDHGAEHGADPKLVAAVQETSDGRLTVKDAAARKKILALRDDPQLASALGAEYACDNKDYLEDKLNRKVGATDLYMAHFLGAGGAGKFLSQMAKSPSSCAATLFPGAADSNRNVFYSKDGKALSLAQVYKKFEGKIAAAGGTAVAAVTEEAQDAAKAVANLGTRVANGIAGTAEALARKFVPSLSTETVLTLASLPIPRRGSSLDAGTAGNGLAGHAVAGAAALGTTTQAERERRDPVGSTARALAQAVSSNAHA